MKSPGRSWRRQVWGEAFTPGEESAAKLAGNVNARFYI